MQSVGEASTSELDDLSDLPSSLIVTNVPRVVFSEPSEKKAFESLFCSSELGYAPTFQYFKSFKRVRVNYERPEHATIARLYCDNLLFRGSTLKCYFAQLSEGSEEDTNAHLRLPPLEKQFLISPPASPPVGWNQEKEKEPVINFDLIARLAALAPSEQTQQEIQAAHDNCPAIVVHTCGDSDEDSDTDYSPKPKKKIPFCHTPRPPVDNR